MKEISRAFRTVINQIRPENPRQPSARYALKSEIPRQTVKIRLTF
jgi:hypothetical protein